MLTIGELATRDGVSKPTVSIAVKRLVEQHGLTVERDGQGRVSRVNAAEYDHLRNRYGDPSKAQAGRGGSAGTQLGDQSEGYDEALRQKTWLETEKRRIELAELRGQVIRRDKLTDALERCAEAIVRRFDQLPQEADNLAQAFERGESHGLRVELRALGRRLRSQVAADLAAIAATAPATDDPIPFVEGRLL